MSWFRRKKQAQTPAPNNKPVGSPKQQCPIKLTSGMTIYVKYKKTNQGVGQATVTVTGPTPWTLPTTPTLGMAHKWPVQDGTYKINVTLPANLLPDYELVPEHTGVVPANSKYEHTFYIVRKPRLKVRVMARRPKRIRTQQNREEWEILQGVTILPLELAGRTASGTQGWADFGVVKPGKYHPTVPNWGPHQGKYELLPFYRKVETTVPEDEWIELTLYAERTGWIEWQVSLDKPKTGEKAELQGVTIAAKVPTNLREPTPTDANGLVRITELDAGACDIEEMTWDKEPLEYVSG